MIKKSLLAIATAAICATGAQAVNMSLGGAFNYATKYNQAGLGLNYQVEVLPSLRFAPELQYFFKNQRFSTLALNLNAQYVIGTSIGLGVYPFAGFTYQHWDYSYPKQYDGKTYSNNRYGLDLGCGAEYSLSDEINIFTEWRYNLVSDATQSVISLGLKYKF